MKRFLPLLIIAGIAALLAAGWFMFGSRILTVYYNGAAERAMAQGRYDAAADAMERLVALSPNSPDLRWRAAETLAESGALSRAEYHLREGIAQGGPKQALLIAALSELYVSQDMLMDAVALLDSVKGLSSGEVAAMRPAAPTPDTEPGRYERPIRLGFSVSEGCVCYISLSSEYPSVGMPGDAPIALPPGETTVRAVAVSPDGVVSELWTGVYTLDNLNYPIVFQEPAMEAAVRAAIQRPEGDIYSRDLTGVTQLLIAEAHSFETLEDLSVLPGLETLSLRGEGTYCDISAIAGLKQLKAMRLEAMGLDSVDIEALAGLTALETLILPRNHLTSLAVLSGLTSLKTVDVSSNSIIDLEPLAALTGLTSLNASQNSVRDLTSLKTLTKLETLNAASNRILSLNGLGPLTGLVQLDVSGNQLSDIRALETLTKLERLYTARNTISDIRAIGKLSALTELDLSVNAIESLEPLQSVRALKRLTVNTNAISSLAPLKECKALEFLDADKNAVESVEALRGLTKLKELRVENNKLKTLSPLLDCPALKSVHAFGNKITTDPAFGTKGIIVYS